MRDDRPQQFFPMALLILGILFPTSRGGNISVALVVGHQMLFCALAVWVGIRRNAFGSVAQLWNSGFLFIWPFAASVLSPFRELAAGAAVVYVTMALLLSLDTQRLETVSLTRVLDAVTLLLLVAGVLVVLGNAGVGNILSANYSVAYPELVPNMLLFRKPVFTFGTHSIAGYFYFLFFYLHLETYRARRRTLNLLLALGCVLVGFLLTSVTAAFLMTCGLALMFTSGGRARWLVVALGLGGALAAWFVFRDQLMDFYAVSNMLRSFESQGSGFSGRFGTEGSLLNNLEVIRSYPLQPIGLTFSPTLFYGDSGPVEYVLRGSFPLLLSVYGGLALFLWRNLRQVRHAIFLMVTTVAFEAGFTVMTYHRFPFFLLFAVLYLNHLSPSPVAARSPAVGEGSLRLAPG